ncbi:M23 family metallopeptidase [Patescibacteria group bacterium]|nr:M23 family metallopeptidase [Patescibacteria group bacterium]
MRFSTQRIVSWSVLTFVLSSVAWHDVRAEEIRPIQFPVSGNVTFSDDFGDPRSGGRTHEGIDILGKKMMPLVAAINGRVSYIVDPEASWGYAVVLRDTAGYTYHYLHVNNDTPGTDDGMGGTVFAYAAGIVEGVSVTEGQLLGWMGDSGAAETTTPHLHFEIRKPDGTPIDPYESLMAATRVGGYDPAFETSSSPTINVDRGLQGDPTKAVFCVSGALIKSTASNAVYYCGADGKRYVFSNQKIFASWYPSLSAVQTLSVAELAAVPLGKNVTYRPGVKLLKIQTDPKVYAVGRGGALRWVTTPEIAAALYGKNWAKQIEDVSDTSWGDYTIGDPVLTSQ